MYEARVVSSNVLEDEERAEGTKFKKTFKELVQCTLNVLVHLLLCDAWAIWVKGYRFTKFSYTLSKIMSCRQS